MTTDAKAPVARAERQALCDTFVELGPDAPTLCDPWRTRDLAAHLVVRERRPDAAVGIWMHRRSPATPSACRPRIAQGDWAQLVETIRTGPPWWSPARIDRVDAIFNTVELVVHHEDALRGDGAVGPRREVPERTARAVLASLRKSASLMFRRSPVGVQARRAGPRADHRRTGGPDARGHRERGAGRAAPRRLRAGCAWPVELDGRPRTSRRCGPPTSASPDARLAQSWCVGQRRRTGSHHSDERSVRFPPREPDLARRTCDGADAVPWRGNFRAPDEVPRHGCDVVRLLPTGVASSADRLAVGAQRVLDLRRSSARRSGRRSRRARHPHRPARRARSARPRRHRRTR